MGINHADGLQVRINNRRPHKFHAALFQILRHPVRKIRTAAFLLINHFSFRPMPDIIGKALEFLLYSAEYYGICNRRPDLPSIADNPGIFLQFLQTLLFIGTHLFQIKIVKSLSERHLFVQYAFPRKPRLKRLQHQHFK